MGDGVVHRHEGPVEDGVDRIALAWLRERPGAPVNAMRVVMRIRRIAKLLEDDQRRLVARLGVDPATRDLLSTLRRSGPPYRLPAGNLARSSLRSSGAISQRVARAELQGLVRRSKSADDARTVLVELTPAGHELIDGCVDEIFNREQTLLADLNSEQQEQLADLLRTLLAELGGSLGVPDWPPKEV